jgi:hypothetical protein
VAGPIVSAESTRNWPEGPSRNTRVDRLAVRPGSQRPGSLAGAVGPVMTGSRISSNELK